MAAIKISSKMDKKIAEDLTNYIERVFESSRKNNVNDKVVIKALELFAESSRPKNINISSCTFYGKTKDV